MQDDRIRDIAPKKTILENLVLYKFSKPMVLVFLLFIALCVSYLIARQGMVMGLLIIGFTVGAPILYAAVAYPRVGIVLFILLSFFINYQGILGLVPPDAPIGVLMDLMTYLLILGFFVKQKNEKDWSYFNDPISYFILIWLGYNMLEVINPAASSVLAWIYTVRTVAFLMLLYFVFVFQIRSKGFIKTLFKLLLILEFISGAAAFVQEKIGFFSFENRWLNAEPLRLQLLFIAGHMRKFGIFSDPVVFAYNMVLASILCLSMLFTNIKPWKKVILVCLMCFYLTVMLYSGTRAAYVLLPAALGMLAILKFNRKVMLFAIAGGLFLGFLIKVPTSNPALARFQSAFNPSKDASFNVRAENQRRIKPYILSHPMGGGLGSVGVWGQRFSPGSFLSKFPPDSGYVRVAVEMGWIGLLLFCAFNFVILQRGIKYYYIIKDPELKTFCMAMVLTIFALDIGNYPQQAFVQYPTNILFYLAMAIINVTMRLDKQKNEFQPG
ncbi:O-antigen ligase [Mucilaginibacter sp. L3T2-6]|uniref:O-antigen ligase family protein n=1 Tax=Mucilaginibacter sp. L3T2-6 TaxID=3062491 RepID=UPI002674E0BD|nr:O-antigen ligase family protein [Mucilaginibacter sp. L3T2-6]MDO3641021.1 O-antigen ligase family protein [Mucilaginibacter sp. L3T2-6]MDV6213503.1 O-antigen ligase family protein [Mucilaginibacter sp. L3T2-6]